MLKRFITDTLPKYGNISLFIGSLGLTTYSLMDNKLKDNLIELQKKHLDQTDKYHKLLKDNEQLIKAAEEQFIKSNDSETIRKSLDIIHNNADNLNKQMIEAKGSLPINDANTDKLNEIIVEHDKISTFLNKYTEIISSNSNKKLLPRLEDLNGIIDDVHKFLLSLSQDHLIVFTHLTGCVSIIYCLISIVFAMFGDKLITFLNLEEKYPKLAKIIKLRRKMLEITVMWNLFLIFLIISLIIYLNILIVIYK